MKITAHYFKRSGKWYTSHEEDVPDRPYYEVVDDWRARLRTGTLPGLSLGAQYFVVLYVGVAAPPHFLAPAGWVTPEPVPEVVVVGRRSDPVTQGILAEVFRRSGGGKPE